MVRIFQSSYYTGILTGELTLLGLILFKSLNLNHPWVAFDLALILPLSIFCLYVKQKKPDVLSVLKVAVTGSLAFIITAGFIVTVESFYEGRTLPLLKALGFLFKRGIIFILVFSLFGFVPQADRKIRSIAVGVCIAILALVAGLYYYSKLPSPKPETAIKKYVFFSGNPIEAFNLEIQATDAKNGDERLFRVSGFYDNEQELVEIPFFWLKKSSKGWRVISAGTGP